MRTVRAGRVVVALLAAASVLSACSTSTPDPGARRPATDTVAPVDGPSVVETTYGDGAALDLYLPAGAGPWPVALLLHGTAPDPSPKDFEGFVAWGERLSSIGIAVAVPNYRADDPGSAAAVGDVESAMATLRARAPELGLDPGRLAVVGFSSAGPTLVASAFGPLRASTRAVVAFYSTIEGPGGRSQSLSSRLSRDELPVLLAFGLQDTAPGVLESRRRFRSRWDGEGVVLLDHPGGQHAFDVFQPGGPTQRILDRTDRFLLRHLAGDPES